MKDRGDVIGETILGQVVRDLGQAAGNAAIEKELTRRGRIISPYRKPTQTTRGRGSGEGQANPPRSTFGGYRSRGGAGS